MAAWAAPLDACSPRCAHVCNAHSAGGCLLLEASPHYAMQGGHYAGGGGLPPHYAGGAGGNARCAGGGSTTRSAVLAESARARLRTQGLRGLIVKVRSTQSNGRFRHSGCDRDSKQPSDCARHFDSGSLSVAEECNQR